MTYETVDLYLFLCSDYEIIAKVLAERMESVLPSIIRKDQTGCLRDRYIGENISVFLDTYITILIQEEKIRLCLPS